MSSKTGYVYILASRKNGTLYVGVTSDVQKRTWQHQNDAVDGFTKNHHVHNLVYFEVFDDMASAIEREKQLKNWKRAWKVQLIEERNPKWEDLYPGLF